MTFRTRIARGLLSAVFVALGGFGIAVGQDNASPTDAPSVTDGELQASAEANLSPGEKVAEADRVLSRGALILANMQRMISDAQASSDVIRITCITEKKVQVETNKAIVAQRADALRSFVESGDYEAADHEFTIIMVINSKFRQLEQAANQCLGQDIFNTGTTSVETSIDPNAPTTDPNAVAIPPDVDILFLPSAASPTS